MSKKAHKKRKAQINAIINAKVKDFQQLGTTIDTPSGPLVHIDNGGDVLAVAHLDHVGGKGDDFLPEWQGDTVTSIRLDDRLGVWALLDYLPTIVERPFDILLTDEEESGRTTAKYYEPEKKYNWIFEFDRRGRDVVLYEYDEASLRRKLKKAGFKIGYGSFSDISEMQHLGIKAMNFGTCYESAHTCNCHASIGQLMQQCQKFAGFYHSYYEERMPHEYVDRWASMGWVKTGHSSWRKTAGQYYPTSYDHRDMNRHLAIDDVPQVDDDPTTFGTPDYWSQYCAICGKDVEQVWSFCPWCGSSTKGY